MKVTKLRLSDQVAKEIQSMILNDDYKAGDKLPVENDLAKMFSVSRITIREAVSKLSLIGIVDVRQGEGTFVKELAPESFMKPLLPMLAIGKKDFQDVFEVRMLIECKNARLAARNATAAELDSLKACLNRMDECVMTGAQTHYDEFDAEFHYLVAKCGHNHVLAIIQELLAEIVEKAISFANQPPNALANSILLHRKIYDAICDRDEDEAFRLMEQHLQGGAGYVDTNL